MTEVGTVKAAASKEGVKVQGIRPCLVFKERADEAINLYVSIFKNSRIVEMVRADEKGPIPQGQVFSAIFELDGREFRAFDGGPSFSFSEGMSIDVTCDTQDEIDRVWEALAAGGGEEGPCGWLKDRFGVSWQIVPAALGTLLSDSKHGNTAKAMDAMLKMHKLDIALLEQAYRSAS
jgi:predicted 3-demethylubiquinone-9 3-methyltransferase (glyoxalase superfamily)